MRLSCDGTLRVRLPSSLMQAVAEVSPDGRTVTARRLIVVDADTGKQEQVWPEAAGPVLSVPIPAE